MEAQVACKDQHNNPLTLVVLFEENKAYSNPHLYSLGFGSGNLQGLTLRDKKRDSSFIVKNVFSLSQFVESQGEFLLYEGSSTVDCKESLVLVSKQV